MTLLSPWMKMLVICFSGDYVKLRSARLPSGTVWKRHDALIFNIADESVNLVIRRCAEDVKLYIVLEMFISNELPDMQNSEITSQFHSTKHKSF